jgi:dihydroorotate dehydrogenase (NAD+) catalytic subunit
MGGIIDHLDAIEFMMAGASAFMVGTANLTDPYALRDIITGLEGYMADNGIDDISGMTGSLELYT